MGARELVGIGEKIALQGFRFRSHIGDQSDVGFRHFQEFLARPQSRVLHRLRDVEHGVAFGNDDRVHVNIAAHQAVMHVHGSRGLVKKIFAGLQRLFAMEPMPEDKGQTAADHARRLQFSGDPAGGVSRAQHYEFLPLRRNGHPQRPRQPAANCDDGKQQEYQKRAQVRNSLDEERVVGR